MRQKLAFESMKWKPSSTKGAAGFGQTRRPTTVLFFDELKIIFFIMSYIIQ
jgi:hypothetical protein